MSFSLPARALDPFDQTITLKLPDGTPFTVKISDIDLYVQYGIRICINYSSQIGASFMLLVLLLLLTRKEKRTSAIFWLNVLTLALNTIRSVLQVLYFSGPWYEFYAQFSLDFSRVPKVQYNVSVVGDVMTFLLVVCLEASLILQTHAVFTATSRLRKYILVGTASLVAIAAIAWRLALTITNAQAILDMAQYYDGQWIAATSNNMVTGSICFSSAIFVTKLFIALHQRRKMGLCQFGPMQVIFIMGCQCLLVPAVFCILQTTTSVPEFGSQVLTVTAIFLPLSSMWASASITRNLTFRGINNSRLLGNYFSTGSDQFNEKHLTDTYDSDRTATTFTKASSTRVESKADTCDIERDLDIHEVQGVRVTNTWEVNH